MRVLLLPSVPYEPLWRDHAAGAHPRPTVTEELRRDHGIFVDSIDPDTGRKNPFGRMHPFFRSFDPVRALRVLIGRRGYDLVISGNDGAAAALLATRGLFRFRTPVIIWDFSPTTEWRVRRIVQDQIIPRISGIIALNEIQRPYVAQRWGAHVPVHVVGHWVDTEFYRPEPFRQRDAILAVGDDIGRDYPTLLRALDGLSARTQIRTSLPLDLDETKHGAVEVISRRLSPIVFRDLYANSRFVVLPLQPSTRNASGVCTILEAAAMGKAVIVSASDGIREFVRHDETGLIVPANDPVALRTAIARLLHDRETSDRLGREARRFVERNASPAVFAGRLATAFRALAGVSARDIG